MWVRNTRSYEMHNFEVVSFANTLQKMFPFHSIHEELGGHLGRRKC